MKTMNKIKLGLAGLVLAGAGMIGCSSTQKINSEPNEYSKAVGKNKIEMVEEATPKEEKTKDLSYDNSDKPEENGTYTSNSEVNESEDKTPFLNWNIYTLERNQAKGESRPEWVRGVGTKANVRLGNSNFNLYGKFEYDEKRKTSTTPIGQLVSNSEANTYGVGIGYSVNPFNWLELGIDSGVFRRDTKHNIKGYVGSTGIDETKKTSYFGAEAGIYTNLRLSDNVWIHGHFNIENHNPGKDREGKVNTSSAYRTGLGVNFKW